MDFIEGVKEVLGLGVEPKDLTVLQVCLRAFVVFLVTLVMVRLANKRFLARLSAFDAIVGFILASMMARAVNGSAPFFPTLAGGFVIVLVHRFLGYVALQSHFFSKLIKGREEVIIENGKVDKKAMRRHHLTEDDLLEELRTNGSVLEPKDVKRAVVERSGKVSVITNS